MLHVVVSSCPVLQREASSACLQQLLNEHSCDSRPDAPAGPEGSADSNVVPANYKVRNASITFVLRVFSCCMLNPHYYVCTFGQTYGCLTVCAGSTTMCAHNSFLLETLETLEAAGSWPPLFPTHISGCDESSSIPVIWADVNNELHKYLIICLRLAQLTGGITEGVAKLKNSRKRKKGEKELLKDQQALDSAFIEAVNTLAALEMLCGTNALHSTLYKGDYFCLTVSGKSVCAAQCTCYCNLRFSWFFKVWTVRLGARCGSLHPLEERVCRTLPLLSPRHQESLLCWRCFAVHRESCKLCSKKWDVPSLNTHVSTQDLITCLLSKRRWGMDSVSFLLR